MGPGWFGLIKWGVRSHQLPYEGCNHTSLERHRLPLCPFDLRGTRRKQYIPVWAWTVPCQFDAVHTIAFFLVKQSCSRDAFRLQLCLSFLHALFILISGSHFNIFRASKKLKIQSLQRNKRWALFPDQKVPGSYGGWRLAITCLFFIALRLWLLCVRLWVLLQRTLSLLNPSCIVCWSHFFLMNVFHFLGMFVLFFFF